MAKPKRKFIIKRFKYGLSIYHVDIQFVASQLAKVEGIVNLIVLPPDLISACISPLYDVDEIADEIEELLSTEIPNIFRE